MLCHDISIYSTISTRIDQIIILVKILDFVTVVSHQERMKVIVIPKRLHTKLEKSEGKQVRIVIEDILI